ncbi:hypothetical protein N9L06_07455 [Mariniblastus sp.]|nr:hypothetical protein [Mariniblastus sp.]
MRSLKLFDIRDITVEAVLQRLRLAGVKIDPAYDLSDSSSFTEVKHADAGEVSFSFHELKGEFENINQFCRQSKNGLLHGGHYCHPKRTLSCSIWGDFQICDPRNHYHDSYNEIRSIIRKLLGDWSIHGSYRYAQDNHPYHYAVWQLKYSRFSVYQYCTDIGYDMRIRYCFRDGDILPALYTG